MTDASTQTREASPRRDVGTLVRARGRDWVVLPSPDPDLLRLRPLGGSEREITGIYLPLEGHDLTDAGFAPPQPAEAGDSVQARLLRDAVRLNFRAGAGPFRSLGQIAVEPRAYQLVPLLMALRLNPVRLLIADDVGIGKTIESLLIARELLDRGEIRRLAVICLPHLCDQWQAEMRDKFGIMAEVVRPGTVGRLERNLPTGVSLFEEYPFVVVSIDYIKSDKRRDEFVRACPEFVIVDEAHAAAETGGHGAQQQRHDLLRLLAQNPQRHLVLTTATPHSGIESAFRSLLRLLDPAFRDLPDEEKLEANHPLRRLLAQHLVQRKRPDIRHYLEDETVFPERLTRESTYTLSPPYQSLYRDVLAYARELVRDVPGSPVQRQRIRWWAALAMLRCVTSSPTAAEATLRTRANGLQEGAELGARALDELGERAVLDLDSADATEGDDVVPGSDTVEGDVPQSRERARLHEMARAAAALRGDDDRKLLKAVEIVRELLAEGCSPIIYCRYIATAEYVAEELGKRLRGVEVRAVTGALPPEVRRERVDALQQEPRRVLVATDCLSEGINLQDGFDAVLHYDLSWNPTRHEQREGRVDRFGQQRPVVRTVLLYGQDNAVDGAVLQVLLRKAAAIRTALGVSVPIPADSQKVLEAMIEAVVLRGSGDPRQLTLDFAEHDPAVRAMDDLWQNAAERERRSRTIFAQDAMRPEEVRLELDEARRALGSYDDVARFVRDALARLGAPLGEDAQGRLVLTPAGLPPAVREAAGDAPHPVGFTLPVPAGAAHIGRTSPLVEALGAYLTGSALDPYGQRIAARAAAIRTRAVTTRTNLLLLRLRMHIDVKRGDVSDSLLAEEVVTVAYRGRGDEVEWLSQEAAEALLNAQPEGDNPPLPQRMAWLQQSREDLDAREQDLAAIARNRAALVLAAHERVRDAARMDRAGIRLRYEVRAVLPPDILGLYVFMPVGG